MGRPRQLLYTHTIRYNKHYRALFSFLCFVLRVVTLEKHYSKCVTCCSFFFSFFVEQFSNTTLPIGLCGCVRTADRGVWATVRCVRREYNNFQSFLRAHKFMRWVQRHKSDRNTFRVWMGERVSAFSLFLWLWTQQENLQVIRAFIARLFSSILLNSFNFSSSFPETNSKL